MSTPENLLQTPLHDLHLRLGARMVPFAGYSMPVQYEDGLVAEHKHCRAAAALFDVSHMGQIRLVGADAAAALETVMPIDVIGLELGRQRYGFFTNTSGGIMDDLMIARPRPDDGFGDLLLVVNAACKAADIMHLQTSIGTRCAVVPMPERGLLALQGPQAATALARLAPGVASLAFMDAGVFEIAGARCFVTRSGYTGEDGFEISVEQEQAVALAEALLAQPEVKPAGLGARDTLRLEAGLCLYGHDIDASTSPIEAGLQWAIPKSRRPGGERAGGYLGSAALERQFSVGAPSKRVGLVGIERVPVREGAIIVDINGHRLGKVTSGTITPTFDQPIAMGYVPVNLAKPQGEVYVEVRRQRLPMRITPMPFVPHRYRR
ncbi:MAG TPA: glycine cleavage system aminomethyltransferase GcvT [Rubrivivax sp.]|nr:glycine cleavage system aminomethyltransferase GcvT [Burkholderiales bacterium]HNU11666.1 glycine cleavage system aminomethyltransferase GcvT [Rubrivivax sp.]